MYVCGPTVYDEPHIGHARSAYIFDVIRRYFAYKGYKDEMVFVRNVTDVDDKIIDRARKEFPGEDINAAVKRVSEKYLDSYHNAMQQLGIMEPDSEPKASEYIDKMISFIKNLIDRGVAYQSGSDVYFDITKAKDYGKLSGQSLEKMEAGARVAPLENKRNPLDFALWKSAKENEPCWESPFGKGRPGWHIECSVMSSDILGGEFDIHGGGLDLIFPHHENEIAQSEGAGNKFARVWMHNGFLTIDGKKMSKSLGNFITINDICKEYPEEAVADILKLFFLQTHYRKPIDFSYKKMERAKNKINDLRKVLSNDFGLTDLKELNPEDKETIDSFKFQEKFEKAMDNDFNTPQALALIFSMVRHCNTLVADYDALKMPGLKYSIQYAINIIRKFSGILGLSLNNFDVKDVKWLPRDLRKRIHDSFPSIKQENILSDANIIAGEEYVNLKIQERDRARQQKNYALADKIRKKLEDEGIILEDSKDGKTTWRRKL